ncbi:MAG: radical SAM protein, partial [Planctomycetota bacterium]
MKPPATHFFDLTPDELADWCAERRWPRFRAKQITEWVYQKGVADPAHMTTLAKREREQLAREMTLLSGATIAHQRATDGTQKLLIEWSEDEKPWAEADGPGTVSPSNPSISLPTLPASANPYTDLGTDPTRQTECVMIPADDRRTACISSQVGCPVGCRFCASGLSGLDGNLTAGRIVEQAWRLARLDRVGRISNIVFMGMGEPLSNFKNVVRAVRTLAAPWGMGISARKITISTVGMHRA